MELKVWVEGIQRIVCGVTERTTCQDVVYALAHATGRTGRFTLIERWRNNERLLAPHEHPLKVLLKWGEYSSDVHFILQRTALEASSPAASKSAAAAAVAAAANNNNNNSNNNSSNSNAAGLKSPKAVDPLHGFTPPAHADWKKSSPSPAVGVVRPSVAGENGAVSPPPSNGQFYADRRPSASNGVDSVSSNGRSSLSPGRHYADAESSSPRAPPPYRNPPAPHRMATPPPSASPSAAVRPVHAPPPYREPPRPRGPSPSSYRASPAPSDGAKCKRNLGHEFDGGGTSVRNGPPSPPADPQHAQLIQLVNRQREKLDSNQELLMRLERDVATVEEQLERRRQEHEFQLGLEAARYEMRAQEQEEEIAMLAHLQGQWDALVREEDQLKGQLDQFKGDLSAAETQLDTYKLTLRNLRDDVNREEDELASELEAELSRVRAELEATDEAERRLSSDDQQVTHELNESEQTLRRLRDEIDRLTQEIKEANLQSLSIAPADDLKVLLEGSCKSGHGRRMLGSPRQLENAVPTNKNPHGVWV